MIKLWSKSDRCHDYDSYDSYDSQSTISRNLPPGERSPCRTRRRSLGARSRTAAWPAVSSTCRCPSCSSESVGLIRRIERVLRAPLVEPAQSKEIDYDPNTCQNRRCLHVVGACAPYAIGGPQNFEWSFAVWEFSREYSNILMRISALWKFWKFLHGSGAKGRLYQEIACNRDYWCHLNFRGLVPLDGLNCSSDIRVMFIQMMFIRGVHRTS